MTVGDARQPAPAAPAEIPSATARPMRWPGALAWLPIPLFAAAVVVLRCMNHHGAVHSPALLTALNTVFIAGAALLVSFVAARSYLRSASRGVLFLGCGMLTMATAALLMAPLARDTNDRITVHNIGNCLAVMWVLASALQTAFPRLKASSSGRQWTVLVVAYGIVLVTVSLVATAAIKHILPPFYADGHMTPVRQFVIEAASLGFFFSAVLFGFAYARSRMAFMLWYAFGMAMMGLGLAGVGLAAQLGSPLNWVGRFAQWAACIYMLVAVLSLGKGTPAWQIDLERSFLRLEWERNITVGFLQLVNQSVGTRDLARAALDFILAESGYQAVGIRLKNGDDYPYYECRGFEAEFVAAEGGLCARDGNGLPVRDQAGNPVLECMCGAVIGGRVDPSKPFFTRGGSFWTNSTTRLLAKIDEIDRPARMRNRCNIEGYESVALVPLRLGATRLGLLQLNDRRRGMFSTSIIALWERLADQLAIALAKFQADEELRVAEEILRQAHSQLEMKVNERTAELSKAMAKLRTEIEDRLRAEEALRAVSRQLVIAREEERKRLAGELHDSVGQELVALNLTLKAALPNPGQELTDASLPLLQKAAGMSGELIREIRNISQDIYPPTLESLGLLASLRQLASRMGHGIRTQVICPKPVEAARFEADIEITLFRVAQEAVNNALRHGKATSVELHLACDDGGVTLQVRDNGGGFDASRVTHGMGLQTMTHRVQTAGGKLTITSGPGGTEVEARIPMQPPASSPEI